MNSSDEATKWKQELRRQVVEAAIDRHDDDLSLVRAVAINDAYPVIAAAVRAEAVADERRRTLEWALAKAEDEVAVGDESWFQPEHGETATECTVRFIKALLAAGSVPVATPPAEPAEPAQAEPMVGIFDVIAVQQNYRRHLLSLDPSPAISEWIATTTGLPIDFQFQDEAEWDEYDSQTRHPRGLIGDE